MEKDAAIAALGALAQETRLDVFRLLVERGPQGLPAGAIAGALDFPHMEALLRFLTEDCCRGACSPPPARP